MKKISTFFFVFGLLACQACQKDVNEGPFNTEPSVAPLSFVASAPSTKTALSDHSVTWASGDEITVIAHSTASDSYDSAVFEITDGIGSGSAVFTIKSGESLSDTYDSYYAVYPALNVTATSSSITLPRLNASPNHMRNQAPVDGGFDRNLAIMTASFDGTALVFRHGVGYVKITIPIDGVTAVEINFTNNCLADTPTYNASTGALSSVANSNKSLKAFGNFVKGESYYLAAVPRSGYTIGTTTVTYTLASETVTASTDHFSGKAIEVGKIFDLGSPVVATTPKITFTQPGKLASDATAGSFTYTLTNAPDGATVSAAITSGSWISNVSVSGNTVSFDCEENTDTDERTAVITLSYAGAEDVAVTLIQGAAGASVKESHNWNFADYTDAQMETITGLAADAKAAAGLTWDFGNGLTMVTNSSSKWNNQNIGGTDYKWVATGGKYGSNQKYFSFTTQSVGTITVLYASGGSASRALTVKAGGAETTDSANVSTGTSDLKTVTFSSVASGLILLYSKDDNVRIFSINYLED